MLVIWRVQFCYILWGFVGILWVLSGWNIVVIYEVQGNQFVGSDILKYIVVVELDLFFIVCNLDIKDRFFYIMEYYGWIGLDRNCYEMRFKVF